MVEDFIEDMQEDVQEDVQEDEYDKQLDIQQEAQEDMMDGVDYTPAYKEKEDLYSLLKWIIARKDSTKVGNVLKEELGMLNITVRDAMKISLLAYTLNHPGFARFFREQAEIVLSSSLSRDAHLIDLFVTTQVKKKTTKSREYQLQQQQFGQPQPKKRRRFL